jgi:predicted nucleic acid-binding protein
MRREVILDTGPLVAFLNRRDRYHSWAAEQLGRIETPLYTCEAVLSEACFLLRKLEGGSDAVLEFVHRGLVTISFALEPEVAPVRELMRRFSNVPMSLADACLVRMTELRAGSLLLTLDRDFRVYRKHGRLIIPTIMPEHLH